MSTLRESKLSSSQKSPAPQICYNRAPMTEVRLQTYWVDSDPAGIVYFAHFFKFIEQAEEELYLRAGTRRQQLLDDHHVWMPRVEAHVQFTKPIRNGYAIRVR